MMVYRAQGSSIQCMAAALAAVSFLQWNATWSSGACSCVLTHPPSLGRDGGASWCAPHTAASVPSCVRVFNYCWCNRPPHKARQWYRGVGAVMIAAS